ncbi:MAG: malectin domain-containing carbohydrate-binding protein [Sphingobacteriaceae bacterium]
MQKKSFFLLGLILAFAQLHAQQTRDILLNDNWLTQLDTRITKEQVFRPQVAADDPFWKRVNVPHNWDDYGGYRRLMHGNLHGNAWYRKQFKIKAKAAQKIFLFFEGVGDYATVWLNGKEIGKHAGGRTTFTLDASEAVFRNGANNELVVYAEHPADIRNLPWVCGGCSPERGFSEGSQPLGIFRPVHLLVSNPIKIAPFGIHAWNDTTVTEQKSTVFLQSELINYQNKAARITLTQKLLDRQGKLIRTVQSQVDLQANATLKVAQQFADLRGVKLWSPEDPYLYRIVTELSNGQQLLDSYTFNYGIRWVRWPKSPGAKDNRFYVNGKPVFINGIAEYEHSMGYSHAFSPEEIRSRVATIQQAGFNAFRDAHQPHNLLYGDLLEQKGLLWWTQFSAHVWFDNPAFRENFKTLLREWVKERRNNPAIIMWGLQNESRLPKDFAEECTQIIREMDPTATSQRLVTTCNGGEGTDWDVPQNWTGTYGGDPATYAEDLKKQNLVGEYGSWRTLGLHLENAYGKNEIFSEERMVQLMEQKVRLADSVKTEVSGHYFWLFNSHDNPGRVQGGEGYRETDAIGPVNYKGLFTSWGEPTDVYAMYRSNYAPKANPMIYIASHTWPSRWTSPGIKNDINIYSNCDEVVLYNDLESAFLAKQKRKGLGTHFTFNGLHIKYNILYAVGYLNGKAVVRDTVVLNHLPPAPHFNQLYQDEDILKGRPDYHYLYRVNCGGAAYTDSHQQLWLADIKKQREGTWGSTSWTAAYAEMPAYFASQRKTFDPIKNTKDWPLLQTFRFGRDELRYEFPVKNGNYLVELYFMEPWLGGGDLQDYSGERLINVAVNGHVEIKDLDIWKEAGHLKALKKTIPVQVSNGKLVIHFPQSKVGQAVLSAIAIASRDKALRAAPASPALVAAADGANIVEWLNIGDRVYADSTATFSQLPPKLFNASLLQSAYASHPTAIRLNADADVFVAISNLKNKPSWLNDFENTQTTLQTDEGGGKTYVIFRKRYQPSQTIAFEKATSNFLVLATPVDKLEPAYDLKPSLNLKPESAKYTSEIKLETLIEKPSLTFLAGNQGAISWDFQTGVADIYSFTLRYANTSGKDLKVQLSVFAADGSLMKTELVSLPVSIAGKWAFHTITTGNMINAGNYTFKISAVDAASLSISQLQVQ